MLKRILAIFLLLSLAIGCPENIAYGSEGDADALSITSKSAILVEAQTGMVLYEKNADEKLKPASVTKVMTLLLVFDAIKSGEISLDDTVTVSEHAASMGGSQCFFEAGEEQKVNDMIKCIEVASGNDAAVAMAEFVAGSEEAFVGRMNEKAAELGMENSHFVNACGLDADNHYTSARDIAIMSRELVTKHPEIFEYSKIWMDYITHKTRRGESRFDLVNTNKFLNMYTGATGLKTGYTSSAKYCMSATAKRNDINLIAVIMGAETKDVRNKEACRLLDYGFSRCSMYCDEDGGEDIEIPLKRAAKKTVCCEPDGKISFVVDKSSIDKITKSVNVYDNITPPVKKGDVLGKIEYRLADKTIYSVELKASEDVNKITYKDKFIKCLRHIFLLE